MRIKDTKLNTEVSRTQNSNLAKLLATENITVEHQNIATAYFDVQNRILGLPIWKDVGEDVYDLLVGHEVGHALFTPDDKLEDLCSSIDDNPNSYPVVKSYINILEDIRIEKKIKRKFGGLRKSFYRGYTELVEKDFFGTDGRLLESYSFIDRINLRFKTGMDIPFNDREKDVVRRLENLETFEEVLSISKELYEGSMDNEKFETEVSVEITDESGENSGDTMVETSPSGTELSDSDEETEEGSDASEEDADGEETEDEDSNEDSGAIGTLGAESETQDAFDKNSEHELIDPVAVPPFYCNIPEIDSEPFIVDTKIFHKSLKDALGIPYYTDKFGKTDNSLVGNFKRDYTVFKNDSKKTVNYLVKEFEMKKNAEQYARATTSKSGVIDVNKLHSYRFSDDIFRKITVVPDGKNHGLVIFVDWSSSMHDNVLNTIKQLLNLVWFAKKINIPFDVYAFSDAHIYDRDYTQNYKVKDIVLNNINLLHFFSSNQKSMEFNESCVNLFCLGSAYGHGVSWNLCTKVRLSSTPLNEAIILAHDIIEKFKTNNRLSVVNSIFLTDGEANSMNYIMDDEFKLKSFSIGRFWNTSNSYLTDTKTKITYKICDRIDVTNALLKSLQDRLGINVIGFFIAGRGYDAVQAVRMHGDVGHSYDANSIVVRELTKKLNRDKSLIIDHEGYTEFYIIKGGSELDTNADELEVDADASKRVITTAFKKHTKSKTLNRVILSRFVELIA
jgi:hypothetical protein